MKSTISDEAMKQLHSERESPVEINPCAICKNIPEIAKHFNWIIKCQNGHYLIWVENFDKNKTISEWNDRNPTGDKCIFDNAWSGKCGRLALSSGLCENHLNLKCSSCNSQTIKQCTNESSLVCGRPLCNNCR